jgi:hypothetical protein
MSFPTAYNLSYGIKHFVQLYLPAGNYFWNNCYFRRNPHNSHVLDLGIVKTKLCLYSIENYGDKSRWNKLHYYGYELLRWSVIITFSYMTYEAMSTLHFASPYFMDVKSIQNLCVNLEIVRSKQLRWLLSIPTFM